MDFSYRLRVRYPECDAQAIVFNARYGDWADLATTEFLRVLLQDTKGGVPMDYRLVSQTKTWRRPARFDDIIECLLHVSNVGSSSFRVQTSLFKWRADTGCLPYQDAELLAEIQTTYVQVDANKGEKLAISEALRSRLLAGAPDSCTDHAGVGTGRIIRRRARESWKTMPWKNGGGITHEILREGEGGDGWGFRLSLAEVKEAGPFSQFPGVDRVIMLVEGKGFVLQRNDGLRISMACVGSPFAFHGEDSWSCTLIDGSVMDFNVMHVRGAAVAVAAREPGLISRRFFLCLEAGEIGGVLVERLELVELSGSLWSGVCGIEVG
jgi:acyl-CoA thioester hydrolase